MSLNIDENGTITLYQGDSGEIAVSGLDETKNYVVYFAIQDKQRKPVGQELYVSANKTGSVSFFLTSDYTDLLTVPKGKAFETYTYGVKACDVEAETEDTLFVSNGNYGDVNSIIVYPRKVMGG